MKQKEFLQEAVDNLPREYVAALQSLELEDRVNQIAKSLGIRNEDEITQIDREVTLFLLRISNSPEFTQRLGERLDISNQKLHTLITKVTETILKPLQEKVGIQNTETNKVPPPPAPPGTPQAGYGGTSDPYQEPTSE